MTTDITELAQRMKAAVVRAKAATEDYVAHRMSITVCLEECKEFNDLSDGPDNILALVEALGKAQEGEKQWREVVDAFCADDADWHKLTNSNNELISFLSVALCKHADRIDELEPINAAAEKLVRCKGRHHSEQNYRALAALFGVTTPDLPPLEHENVHYADAAEMEIAALRQRIAELEPFQTAYMEWSDKTDWMQGDKRIDVVRPLGKHRVDVLKEYIEYLESRTVKLPLPRRKTIEDYVDDTFEPCDLAAVYNACRLECEVKFKNALTVAGIKWESE